MSTLSELIEQISYHLNKIGDKSNYILCCNYGYNGSAIKVSEYIKQVHHSKWILPMELVERYTKMYCLCQFENCISCDDVVDSIFVPFLDYPTISISIIQKMVTIIKKTEHLTLLKKLIEKGLIDNSTKMNLYLICGCYAEAKEIMKIEHPTTMTLESLLSKTPPNNKKKIHFELLHFILGYKMDISSKVMEKAIEQDDVNYVSILISYGYKPQLKDLEKLFEFGRFNQDTFKKLLETGIVSNNQIFNNLLDEYNRSAYPKMTFESLIDLVNCMIDNGYKLTKENVICAIKYKVAFPDLQKFGISIDDDILNACVKAKYYPYTIKNKPAMGTLYEACAISNNLSGIKKIISAGCQPDQKCLEIASTINPNLPVIKYLIEKHNLKPTKTALMNVANTTNKNKTLMYMLNLIEIK